MEIFKIVSIGIVSTVLAIVLKNQKTGFEIYLVLITSILFLVFIFSKLQSIVELINKLIDSTEINREYITIILKVVGISYMVEFGRNICMDAGQSAIASKIEIAGKVIIVSLSIPVITSLVDLVATIV